MLYFKNLIPKFCYNILKAWVIERKKKRDYNYLISHGVETEYGFVTLYGLPIINKAPDSHIIIGKDVTLVSDSKYNLAGINHPCILSTTRPKSILKIGEGSGLSGVTISCANQIKLKSGVGIGVNVCIYDHDFHGIEPYNRCSSKYVKSSPIIIEEFAWIGANSTILKGVKIGKAAVVGACSVVTSCVPDLSIYAGNPAKYVKDIVVEEEKYEEMFVS